MSESKMTKTSTTVLIICHLFAFAGFVMSALHSWFLKLEGGSKVIALLWEVPNPPSMQIGFMTALCFMGTLATTTKLGHMAYESIKEKEGEECPSESSPESQS